ncbi:variable surface lipoprotein [Mycoplasmopsis columboralis]|uniref:variable surface lipoprotein n=1 Tax=Mycoplasmopsis columboralis TaxID=171282 RepID=UPI00055FC5CF|nr:variable surface lipoprotein [Mycoplasmopsis columboralis]
MKSKKIIMSLGTITASSLGLIAVSCGKQTTEQKQQSFLANNDVNLSREKLKAYFKTYFELTVELKDKPQELAKVMKHFADYSVALLGTIGQNPSRSSDIVYAFKSIDEVANVDASIKESVQNAIKLAEASNRN